MKSFVVACLVSCAVAQVAKKPCDKPDGTPLTGFVADPTACENYISCVGGIAFNAKCPSPLVFEIVAEVPKCVVKTDSNCKNCRGTGITKVQDPKACNKWILCNGDTGTGYECAEGTLFNSASGVCELKENSKCDIDPCFNPSLTATDLLVPNPVSSVIYHLCDVTSKKTIEKLNCAPGLTFDKTEKKCVIPPKVCP